MFFSDNIILSYGIWALSAITILIKMKHLHILTDDTFRSGPVLSQTWSISGPDPNDLPDLTKTLL